MKLRDWHDRGMWPYYPELLARPVPRYTSFPTAAEFGPETGRAALEAGIAACEDPISFYAHIPFCHQICWYCGCNTGAAGKAQRLNQYMAALDQEIDLVSQILPKGRDVARIALGGGSPNAIAPLALVRLLDRIITAFGAHDPQISIEIDPRGFTAEWARVLGATRISHASLGVQTFAPAIQQAIGRIQSADLIARAVSDLRHAGVASINFDLMYGLPGQSMADLDDTLERTLELRPERIALFGYAHVPHLLPRQRRIDASNLPDQAVRFAMAAHGHDLLVDAGYVAVGFDHFALPGDGMARAMANGTLRRNFQGFTDDPAEHLIGLGASAISQFPDRIIQNEKNAGRYREALAHGRLTGALGIMRSTEDRQRALVIEDILCGRVADLSLVADLVPVDALLAPFIMRNLVRLDDDQLHLLPGHIPYARTIAALFDPYRAPVTMDVAAQGAPQRFSTAV